MGASEWLGVSILCLLSFLFYKYTIQLWRHRTLPPGPPILPIVGSLPYLRGDMRKQLVKLGGRYGDVFTIYLGSKPAVVLNSFDKMKQTLSDPAFSGRPWTILEDVISQGKGISSAEGEAWRDQRRFSLMTLKNFGMGKSSQEECIREEIDSFLQELANKEGETISTFSQLLGTSVSDYMGRIVFGERFKDAKYVNNVRTLFELAGQTDLSYYFPVLKLLPGDLLRHEQLKELASGYQSIIRKIICEHRQSFDENNLRDFIDVYLRKVQLCKQDSGSTFTEEWLQHTVADLINAAFEPTVVTLSWAIFYMLHFPGLQFKVQEEIRQVIGSCRRPEYNDRSNMPFTMATISEIQRVSDAVPFSLLHKTVLDDVIMDGYHIPRGTTVIPNLYAVHHDSRYWDKPHMFDPYRFLDASGNFKKSEHLIPFSIGERACLGQPLGRMHLFLYFTNMLQHFTFLPPEDASLPSIDDGILGLTFSPKPYKMRVKFKTDSDTDFAGNNLTPVMETSRTCKLQRFVTPS